MNNKISKLFEETREDFSDKRFRSIENTSITLEDAELLYGLIRFIKPSYAIQTGTAMGISAACIASALDENATLKTCDIVIAHQKEFFDGIKAKIEFIKSDALEFINGLADGIEFAFIDDLHAEEHVEKEITALLPKMKNDGLIVCHDTRTVPQLTMAVVAAVVKYKYARLITLQYGRGLIIVQKAKNPQ